MTREQAEQIAWNHSGWEYTAFGRSVLTIQQVIDAIMEAVAVEREACARVCDEFDAATWDGQGDAVLLAAAIRARGNE